MTVADKILRAKADYGEVHKAGKTVGYGTGYSDGKQSGYTEGYDKCTEDMQDDLQAKYDEGYENGNQVGVAIGIEQGIEQGKKIGYAEGYAAGKAEAGGGTDTYGVEEMLTKFPFLRKVGPHGTDEWGGAFGSSGAIVGTWDYGTAFTYLIVPPWVTEVQECAFDGFASSYTLGRVEAVIFLPKTPPIIGWQGMWSSDAGCNPPNAIFVPDESIEAYKNTENLTAYADLIKPLSEYNGEGYHGGKL